MSSPEPGHKLDWISYRVVISCECGWNSGTYCGKGARAFAFQEWRQHVSQHQAATRKLAKPG